MKKYLNFLLTLTVVLSIISCDDNPTDPVPTEGDIALFSTPSGASILIDGNIKGTTPDTITTALGLNDITFRLANYRDTTISVSVTATNLEILSPALTPKHSYFGLLKVWETGNGSVITQPSGIDLSDGLTVALSGADSLKTDIYYTGSNFTIRSAGYLGSAYRISAFKEGTASDVNDGVDSPVHDTSWLDNMPDDINGHYYYIYDHDENYSKFRVVNAGGAGTWGDPKWVEVEWVYTLATGEVNF